MKHQYDYELNGTEYKIFCPKCNFIFVDRIFYEHDIKVILRAYIDTDWASSSTCEEIIMQKVLK